MLFPHLKSNIDMPKTYYYLPQIEFLWLSTIRKADFLLADYNSHHLADS